jgi:hypothetical protein
VVKEDSGEEDDDKEDGSDDGPELNSVMRFVRFFLNSVPKRFSHNPSCLNHVAAAWSWYPTWLTSSIISMTRPVSSGLSVLLVVTLRMEGA